MATIKYFPTRDAARIVAREEGETFLDMGKEAEKGKRWAVSFKELSDVVEAIKAVEMNVPTQAEQELNRELMAAFAAMDIKPAKLVAPGTVRRTVHSTAKSRNGNVVDVFTTRSVPV